MKKKIRDLTIEDMPKCFDKLFKIDNAFIILFTEDKEEFDSAKRSIPEDILDQEIEVSSNE